MEGKGMRFLSFSNDKEDAEKEAKLREAAQKIEQAIAREKSLDELVDYKEPVLEESADLANDTRPLYERLLEQRNKKKEAADESGKLSNLITTLDEDDVSYLNEVAKNKREEELKRRLEVYDIMEEKKRLDDKRIEEEEKRKKETLLGKRPSISKSSSLKSKIAVKVKPKFVTEVELKPNPKSEQHDTSKRAASTETPRDDEVKRQKIDECSCYNKDTVQCVGILPSLPIVKKVPDSSDESDYSDDDLNRRLVPRTSGRRRR